MIAGLPELEKDLINLFTVLRVEIWQQYIKGLIAAINVLE